MVSLDTSVDLERFINIASNENSHGPSRHAIEAGMRSLDGANRYAESGSAELAAALAKKYKLNVRGIVCGFGSDDLLARLARAYLSPGDELIYSVNGYQKTPNYAHANDAVPVAAPDKNFTADVDSILSCVTARTRMVMLANPDNPTGTYVPGADIRRLHGELPENVLLVLDSAYLEYVEAPDFEDPGRLVEECHNVVMTRTFSKIHGLAGIRLGWLYAPEEIADSMYAVGITFPVSSVALACGLSSLSDDNHLAHVRSENLRVRRSFSTALTDLGISVYPSQTNFVLAKFETKAKTAAVVYDYLFSKGVLVRRFMSPAFSNCIRFTIGREDEMTHVAGHLRAFFAPGGGG